MKKLIALILAFSMLAMSAAALGDTYVPTASEIALTSRPADSAGSHVTVGNTTRVSGSFFTRQLGNNTSDMDVRAMIHGYNPVNWLTQMDFTADQTVVSAIDAEVIDGNTVYTVTLNKGLVWNDGKTPVTAADYVFSHLLLASPEFAAIGADTDVWQHIVGYEEYAAGETATFSGVRLLDEYSYSVTVKGDFEPYFYELSYLSVEPYPISVIAPECVVADNGEGAYIANQDAEVEEELFTADLLRQTILDPVTGYQTHPVLTCGPYSLTEYDREAGRVEFIRNPYYKGNAQSVCPWIESVTLIPVLPENMIEQLENGDVDLLNKCVDGDVIAAGRQLIGEGFNTVNYARFGYGFITYACEKGSLQSQNVRQAIACAFDTEAFTREYLKGFGLPVKGYYGLGQWMTGAAMGIVRPDEMTEEEEAQWDAFTLDDLDAYAYDLNRAEALLTADGWTLNENGESFVASKDSLRYRQEGDALIPLTFTFAQTIGNPGAKLAADMLMDSFDQLGIGLTVEEVTFGEVLEDRYRVDGERKYDLSFMATNFVSTFDPYTVFNTDGSENGMVNVNGLVDETLTELAWQMHITHPNDLTTYETRWIAFQQRYNELLPTLPIYSNVYFDFHSDSLKNYFVSAESGWPEALLYAYWSDAEPEEEDLTDTDDVMAEDDIIIID